MQLLVIQSGERRMVPVQDLKKGKDGNLQTLDVMIPMVREAAQFDLGLRDFTWALISDCQSFDCQVGRLFDYARLAIAYVNDPVDTERLQDWSTTVENGAGDCDDKAILLASMLGSVGIPSRFVCLNYYDDLEEWGYDHVFLEVEMADGSWDSYDPTPRRGRAGQEAAAPVRTVFEIWPTSEEGVNGWLDDLVRQGIQTGVQLGTSYAQQSLQQSRVSSAQSQQVGQQFESLASQVTRLFDSIQAQTVITEADVNAAAAGYQQLAQMVQQYGGAVPYIAEQWGSGAYKPAYEARLVQMAKRVQQTAIGNQQSSSSGGQQASPIAATANSFLSSLTSPAVLISLAALLLAMRGRR